MIVNGSFTDSALDLGLANRNITPLLSSTRELRKAIDAVLSGVAPAGPIVIVGDSASAGHHGGATPANRLDAWPAKMVDRLTALGIPANRDSFFGSSNFNTTTGYAGFDARVTFGTGWTIQNQCSAGGLFFKFAAATTPASLAFTPSNAFDQVDVYCLVASTSTPNISVLRGATTGTPVNVDGAVGSGLKLRRIRTTFGSAATGTINIQASDNAQAQFFVLGAVARNTAIPQLEVINMAAGGSNSADWVASALGVYAPMEVVKFVAPKVIFYAHSINDYNSGVTLGGNTGPTTLVNYQANVASYINLIAGATTILCLTNQSNPVNFASVATQQTYADVLASLSALYGCPYLNFRLVGGDFTQASADGLMADDRHGLLGYYIRQGRMAAQLVARC